jgi:hypothetical protein
LDWKLEETWCAESVPSLASPRCNEMKINPSSSPRTHLSQLYKHDNFTSVIAIIFTLILYTRGLVRYTHKVWLRGSKGHRLRSTNPKSNCRGSSTSRTRGLVRYTHKVWRRGSKGHRYRVLTLSPTAEGVLLHGLLCNVDSERAKDTSAVASVSFAPSSSTLQWGCTRCTQREQRTPRLSPRCPFLPLRAPRATSPEVGKFQIQVQLVPRWNWIWNFPSSARVREILLTLQLDLR